VNIELFIAKRIFRAKENRGSISLSIVRIAVIGIALGLIIMIFAVAIITGFKQQIRSKIIGFGSNITIVNYDSNNSLETKPIDKNQEFYPIIKNTEGIHHLQVFATKLGVIKTDTLIQGVALKGIGSDFDWSFFKQNIVEGKPFKVNSNDTVSNKALISKHIASLLKLKVGDQFVMYFIQQPPRYRKFTISGIYKTSLEEIDRRFILVDIKHIQKLNDWSANQISGYEVLIDNYDDLDKMKDAVSDAVGYQFDENGQQLKVRTIKDDFPQIFDWLDLTDTNVWVILTLMVIVAGFNMVSGLLILILERVNMIGILKALGCESGSIQKIFLYNAAFLVGKGMFWGNVVGIVLCLIQYHWEIVKLNPETYYLSTVPINLKLTHLLLLNIGTLAATILMLVVPTFIINKIKPVEAIRFN